MVDEYRFPFTPYPDGWYVVAWSDELKPGTILSRKYCGHELVIFRTQSGKPAVTDAYCPHMGAHFGKGGAVEGEVIKCPFHFFCFDTDGKCVSTPYGGKVPPKAKLRTWHVRELHGLILMWHHHSSDTPLWEVPDMPLETHTPMCKGDWMLRTHPQETTENSVDTGHLQIVHGYRNIETIDPLRTEGSYLTTTYAFTRDGFMGPLSEEVRAVAKIHVHGLGYSFVDVSVEQFGMSTRHFVLPTPVDEQTTHLRAAVSVSRDMDLGDIHPTLRMLPKELALRAFAEVAWRTYVHDLSQDFEIWQNKVYIDPPVLAQGDGPIGPYRRWCKQFYPDSPRRRAMNVA